MTFITTNLVALAAIIVWRVHPAIVLAVWLPFIMFDGLYLTSSLTKVPDGAWFTLLLAACLAMFFGLWRYGKETQWLCEAKDRAPLSSLVASSAAEDHQALTEKYGGGELFKIDGIAIFLDKSGAFTPKVYEQWLSKFRAQMNTVVFMHLRALSVPHVPEDDRFEVTETHIKNVFRLIVRHGYNDHVVSPDLAGFIYQELRSSIIRGDKPPSQPEGMRSLEDQIKSDDSATAARLDRLEAAFTSQTLYMVGKQQMRINPSYNIVKRLVLEIFLWVRENSRSKVEKLNVPAEKLVEVGFVGVI